jgi:hypothetical protein
MDTGRRHDERHDQCGGEAVQETSPSMTITRWLPSRLKV